MNSVAYRLAHELENRRARVRTTAWDFFSLIIEGKDGVVQYGLVAELHLTINCCEGRGRGPSGAVPCPPPDTPDKAPSLIE